MGKKRAKIISRDAFAQAFVEAEMVMRRNLGRQIINLIDNTDNEDIIKGLEMARDVVIGKVIADGS
jgi:hypothetical protein